tara:strand:+ start:623 stop:982 length:360 start_codon:yes stop_codon:yes gene_type:complete
MVELLFIALKYKNKLINLYLLTLRNLNLVRVIYMANHKSAKKRSRQSVAAKAINVQYLSKIRTNLNSFDSAIKSKNIEEANKSLSVLNSSMAKAVKRGIIKKQMLSRKLSSLSSQIKKI